MSNQPERPWLVPDPWETTATLSRRERRRQYDRTYRRMQREARWEGAVGALHHVACDGKHGRRANRFCQPIPVFR